jgi:two-component system response regulator TctD
MRILVVEDDPDIGEAVSARFRRLGHGVTWERDGETADDMLRREPFDLVILDVGLPGRSGLDILKKLRQRRSLTPVLVLTARSKVDDRVDGLDIGADDYMVKPFDFRELEARARALLRRNAGAATNVLSLGAIAIDRTSRTVAIDGRAVQLTRREVSLLEILVARPGRVFSKDYLLDQLVGSDEAPSENAVEQLVARLRRKLANSGSEIRTMRGIGYQIVGK